MGWQLSVALLLVGLPGDSSPAEVVGLALAASCAVGAVVLLGAALAQLWSGPQAALGPT